MIAIRTSLVLAAMLALIGACTSAGTEGTCERIAEACHPKDTGSGVPHDCHEYTESGVTDDQCAEREDECLAACK